LFENKKSSAEIKVIDFGLSKKILGTTELYDGMGRDDLYHGTASITGSIFHTSRLMECRRHWVHGKRTKRQDLVGSIPQLIYVKYPPQDWDGTSDQAKDFVSKLLILEAKERLTAAEAWKHDWTVQQEPDISDEAPRTRLLNAIDDCRLNYQQTSDLKN
jgi:serine/threonine protein kinase